MRYLVFSTKPTPIFKAIREGVKVNIDLAQTIVIRENLRRARIYGDGWYEEYEIANVIDIDNDRYYIAGQLLEECKPDYREPVRNNLKEVLI